jgi:PAS domain S-box-containing protein
VTAVKQTTGEGWRSADPRQLLDEVPSGVVVIDRTLTIVDHNRAFAKIFDGARGRHCYQAIRGRQRACPDCPVRAAFADGADRTVEIVGRDRSGRDIPLLVSVSPIDGGEGRVEHVAAIMSDLGGCKRLQHEYQTLFEQVPCFVAVINRDHRVVQANDAFRRTFGEPTGEQCFHLYKRRRTPCRDCAVRDTFADGAVHSRDETGIALDGRIVPFRAVTAPLLAEDGAVTHVLEMGIDLATSTVRGERAQKAGALQQAFVASSAEAIVIFDDEQRLVSINEAAERLFGHALSQLVGRRLPRRILPEDLRGALDGDGTGEHPRDVLLTGCSGQVSARVTVQKLEVAGCFLGTALIARARGSSGG